MLQVRSLVEAVEEYEKYQHLLVEEQRQKLLAASISLDGDEWCILSGPDLSFDRAGFGRTVAEAMHDYLSVYIKRAV